MRSNKMITKEEMPCLFIKFSQHILKGNAWISVWRYQFFRAKLFV